MEINRKFAYLLTAVGKMIRTYFAWTSTTCALQISFCSTNCSSKTTNMLHHSARPTIVQREFPWVWEREFPQVFPWVRRIKSNPPQ